MWLQAGEWGGGVHYTEAGWQGCDTYSENKEMLGPVQWHGFRDGDDAPSVCLSVYLSVCWSVSLYAAQSRLGYLNRHTEWTANTFEDSQMKHSGDFSDWLTFPLSHLEGLQ